MSEERHHLFDCLRDGAAWQARPVDQDDRKPKRARGVELCPRAGAARVLGDHHVDAMSAQERNVALDVERAAGDDGGGVRQRQVALGRIDEPQEVVVFRAPRERREVLPADGQENAGGPRRQRARRSRKIGNMGPAVAVPRRPGRALISAERDPGLRASLDRVSAHSRGERMGGIDDMGYPFGPEKADKAGYAAKAADPCRQRLGHRRAGPAGVGKDRVDPRCGKMPGQQARFGGAAQKKDARHG